MSASTRRTSFVSGSGGFGVASPWSRRTRRELELGRVRYGNRPDGTGFQIAPRAHASLLELRDWIQARGGDLTLFTVPIYYDSEDEGRRRVQREFGPAMGRFAAREGIRFMGLGRDLRGEYDVDEFADENHLNESAAERFSRTLAERLPAGGG
jgi:hypothetical protein